MDTSLYSLLKEYRKEKKIIDPNRRKLMAFQLMKGLAYLEVALIWSSWIMFAIEIWSLLIFF